MAENQNGAENQENTACSGDFLDYIVDTFWASLPEQTADDLGKCKKDALSWVKETVTCLVDDAIKSTDQHLENARRMREAYRATEPPAAENPS